MDVLHHRIVTLKNSVNQKADHVSSLYDSGTSLSHTALRDAPRRVSVRPVNIFVLSSAAQGSYNYVCLEERCSVTSNVRLKAAQKILANGARTLFS